MCISFLFLYFRFSQTKQSLELCTCFGAKSWVVDCWSAYYPPAHRSGNFPGGHWKAILQHFPDSRPKPKFVHQISPSLMDSPTSSTTELCTIETDDNLKLDTRIFKPQPAAPQKNAPVIVLVHPYSIMGGCQGLMKGMARRLANQGFIAVTFDMRGTGRSTGRPSITGFSEVNDVVSVCKWAIENLSADRIILVGSSAGAPIAGSAVDKVKEVIGYVSIGYPFGFTASILFGRHHKAILQSPKPKLFVMGTRDGFTSVKQLQNKLKSAAGRSESHLIEGAGHFQMEGPAFDAQMVNLIAKFIPSIQ